MLSSWGYWFFRHPEICSGDQSRISLLATTFRSFTWIDRRQRLGGRADSQAWWSASWARYSGRPPWRATSRLTVDAARSKPFAISRIDEPEASPREMSSRSTAVSTRSERQQTVNGRMRPGKGAPNPMQRLSRFPAAPHLDPLRRRELHVFPLSHTHHL